MLSSFEAHQIPDKPAEKMAHDTTAYVRARYLPGTGDDVTRGAPSDGMDNMVTVSRWWKWWWQRGIVDSGVDQHPIFIQLVYTLVQVQVGILLLRIW